jgi:hypothetical protein
VTVDTDPRAEERAAREQHRQLTRARKEADRKREKEAGTKLAGIIREELARPRARACRCGITSRTTRAELQALGAGCTTGRWVCPVLDTIRRRMDR